MSLWTVADVFSYKNITQLQTSQISSQIRQAQVLPQF